MDVQVRSLEEAEGHIQSLTTNVHGRGGLHDRLHEIEECFDTLRSPIWKRLLFRIDGWGPWHTVKESPSWRPWRRWWTS